MGSGGLPHHRATRIGLASRSTRWFPPTSVIPKQANRSGQNRAAVAAGGNEICSGDLSNSLRQGTGSSLSYCLGQSIEERWSHERARPVSVAARQGRARCLGAPRQGRSGWCRTFAGRSSLGRRLDGQDARCLLDPGLPEGDGRGRRDAGSDRRRHLLRQPYCRRQRRVRVAVGASAVFRSAV